MRARRAALAATAALLVTLAACGPADEESSGGDGSNVEAPPSAGTSTTDAPPSAEAPTSDGEDGTTDGPDSDESGSDPAEPPTDDSAGEGQPPEEGSSDEQEPAGEDAQWISPGSSDEGQGDLAGGPLLAVDVRSGIHPYYERVVIDLEGEGGNPGWYADYTGDPVEDGSGTPIELDGTAFLHVNVTGFRYPEPDEEFVQGVVDVDTAGVTEVYVSAPFEGQIQVVLGVDSARPYRVFVLPDPMRLVIDVETAG